MKRKTKPQSPDSEQAASRVLVEPKESRSVDGPWWLYVVQLFEKYKGAIRNFSQAILGRRFREHMDRRAEATTRIKEAEARKSEAQADQGEAEARISQQVSQKVSRLLESHETAWKKESQSDRRLQSAFAEKILRDAIKRGVLQIDEDGHLHVSDEIPTATLVESPNRKRKRRASTRVPPRRRKTE